MEDLALPPFHLLFGYEVLIIGFCLDLGLLLTSLIQKKRTMSYLSGLLYDSMTQVLIGRSSGGNEGSDDTLTDLGC